MRSLTGRYASPNAVGRDRAQGTGVRPRTVTPRPLGPCASCITIDGPYGRRGSPRLRRRGFVRQFAQPLLHAVALDVLERLAVDARRAAVEEAAPVGDPQHIVAVHLVVQRVEAVRGRALRFGMPRRVPRLNPP